VKKTGNSEELLNLQFFVFILWLFSSFSFSPFQYFLLKLSSLALGLKKRKTGACVFRFSGSLRRENFIKVELGQTKEKKKSSLSLRSLKALLFF